VAQQCVRLPIRGEPHFGAVGLHEYDWPLAWAGGHVRASGGCPVDADAEAPAGLMSSALITASASPSRLTPAQVRQFVAARQGGHLRLGLRRTETSRLDIADWGRNPAAPEFGRYGMLLVRYCRAKRGRAPERRLGDELGSGRGGRLRREHPAEFGCADHPALWVTERGGRVRPPEINARFEAYRDALGLPRTLTPRSMRHSYVTHLTEDGTDPRFIQVQVGHECDSSTAIYNHVSDDFMNTVLRKALTPAFEDPGRHRKEQ
jgi:integrase